MRYPIRQSFNFLTETENECHRGIKTQPENEKHRSLVASVWKKI